MKKKRLLFCLVLLIAMAAVSGALASQKIRFDGTATMKLADSLVYNRTQNSIRYYKDAKNKVTCGFRVSEGQIALKDAKAALKKSGYKSVKIRTVNGLQYCSGLRTSGTKKTLTAYFNTNDSHFVMLAFTYDTGKAKGKKLADSAVSSIRVVQPEPAPEAPPFLWTGNGGDVSSAVYGGRDLIMVYMMYTADGDNDYIGYYLDEINAYRSKLKKKKITVLVCLTDDAGTEQLEELSGKYPSMVFGLEKDEYEDDLWTALERLGYKGDTAKFPVVILRGRDNRLRCYKAGSIDNAKTVVSKAVAMANENVTAEPPDPDEIQPVVDDVVITAGNGKFKITGQTATFLGVTDESVTELEIPKEVIHDGMTCPVTAIASKACYGLKNLKTLQIDRNVTKIGSSAFRQCSSLKTIVFLTAGLTEGRIGASAFKGIAKKPVVKCPGSVIDNYKKWLTEKGIPENASFKSIRVK